MFLANVDFWDASVLPKEAKAFFRYLCKNMALELPDGESTRELIKCVVVGDGGVGKTKLICAQALGQSIQPETKRTLLQCAHGSHKPSVFAIDKYYKSAEIQARSNMTVDGVPVALRLWDTFGDHQKNRRFAYQNSHVVALCFAVNCPQSLESVNYFWYNEIKNFCPRTPIILVGTKSDLSPESSTWGDKAFEKHKFLAEDTRVYNCDTSNGQTNCTRDWSVLLWMQRPFNDWLARCLPECDPCCTL